MFWKIFQNVLENLNQIFQKNEEFQKHLIHALEKTDSIHVTAKASCHDNPNFFLFSSCPPL